MFGNKDNRKPKHVATVKLYSGIQVVDQWEGDAGNVSYVDGSVFCGSEGEVVFHGIYSVRVTECED